MPKVRKRVAFMGDGRNNVARTLLVGCAQMGVHVSIVAPRSLQPEAGDVAYASEWGARTGAQVLVTDDVADGLRGSDAVYTDVWVSMGEEAKSAERTKLLRPYQVNPGAMEKTGRKDSIFLHCLPAVKGAEVTAEIIEGPRSRVFDQAENRKHTIKALLLATLT